MCLLRNLHLRLMKLQNRPHMFPYGCGCFCSFLWIPVHEPFEVYCSSLYLKRALRQHQCWQETWLCLSYASKNVEARFLRDLSRLFAQIQALPDYSILLFIYSQTKSLTRGSLLQDWALIRKGFSQHFMKSNSLNWLQLQELWANWASGCGFSTRSPAALTVFHNSRRAFLTIRFPTLAGLFT